MAKPRAPTRPKPAPSNALEAPEILEVPAGVFKNTCLALMDEVHKGGKQVVITKHGNAVARLVAPESEAPSAFGFLQGTLVSQGDIASPDAAVWGDLA
jgi:prevent-host-death family protein